MEARDSESLVALAISLANLVGLNLSILYGWSRPILYEQARPILYHVVYQDIVL